MKRTLLSTLVITSTLGLNANVFALSMGELELKSTLNQPLQAEIELTNIDDLTEWEIKPSLASDGDFDRAGVEKLFFLSDIDFEVKGNRILLTSDKSVTEPFLNFLVQVNWPSGRILREYTLLLDPPVFDEEIQPLSAPDVPQRVESQVVTTAQTEVDNAWQSEAAAPGTYKVQPNDTLWEIAINTRPNRRVSPQQMMLAIQDSNPGAFIGGNINRLKTHQVLRIPNQQQMAARNNGQAISEVLRQNQELQTAGAQLDATAKAKQTNKTQPPQDGGELKLLSKQSEVSDSAAASGDIDNGTDDGGRTESLQNDLAIALETLDTSTLENEDLKNRLASLEEQIATLQRLVSLKDDQLASLQTMELQKAAAEDASSVTAINTSDAESSDTISSVDNLPKDSITSNGEIAESSAAEGADYNYTKDSQAGQTEATPEPIQAPVETTPEVPPSIAASQIQQEIEDRYKPKGWVAEIMAKPTLLAGLAGGLALLLGLIGLAIKQRRSAKEGEIEDPELEAFGEDFEYGEHDLDDASLDDFEFEENDGAPAEELTDDLLDGIGNNDTDELQENETTDTVAQTSDIIGEAEIYIAYGRFDQAADLLNNSIQQDPTRIDLRMKLLEVFVEADDANGFAEAELNLNSIGDLDANEKAAVMRSRLSAPINGVENSTSVDDSVVSEDLLDMEGLEEIKDDFADGIDFEAALDLSDDELMGEESDEFAASLDTLDEVATPDNSIEFDLTDEDDIPTLDEMSAIEDVPTLEVDDVPTLEALDDVPTLEELDDVPTLEALDDVPTLEALDDVPTLEALGDVPTLEALDDVPTLEALDDAPTLEALDDAPALDDLDELSADLNIELDPAASEQDLVVDLDALDGEDSSAITELEDILNSDESMDELPDLSFDLDETGFEGDSLDDDLQSLEAELGELAGPVEELDASSSESTMTVDENTEQATQVSSEFDLNELDDLPDFTLNASEKNIEHESPQESQEIDLEELAASDDEFDFLAGTDECATKLDLARAYLDMEDIDGAKELLQEVATEGSDQQKQDARALMDSIG